MHTVKHDPPKVSYSIREACQATSFGRTTIYNHIAAGRLSLSELLRHAVRKEVREAA